MGMKTWIDEETGNRYGEPDCVEDWLFAIWATGCDYDGAKTVEELKGVIDEMVRMNGQAMICLREGKLF